MDQTLRIDSDKPLKVRIAAGDATLPPDPNAPERWSPPGPIGCVGFNFRDVQPTERGDVTFGYTDGDVVIVNGKRARG